MRSPTPATPTLFYEFVLGSDADLWREGVWVHVAGAHEGGRSGRFGQEVVARQRHLRPCRAEDGRLTRQVRGTAANPHAVKVACGGGAGAERTA